MAKRAARPSRAVWMGAPVGAAAAIVITATLETAGVKVGPEVATAITTLCTFAASYLTAGGRRGEAD